MDIERWHKDATQNQAAAPDGFIEGMTRSDVNDSAREVMAGDKRYYDNPDFRNPFYYFSLVRTDGTHWILVDGGGYTNAGQYLEAGQRIKISQGGQTWEGWVDSLGAYSAPNQTVAIEWLSAVSPDVVGPTTASGAVMTVGLREIGKAAWFDTGTASGQVPTVDDLKPYAITTDEADLDVGAVQGLTADQISERSIRGRLNPNGGFQFWRRGVDFNSSSGFPNNANQSIADNWTLISDGNNRVNITREVDAPSAVPVRYSAKMTVSSGAGANQKHGIITFIELDDGLDLGQPSSTKKLSLSFWTKQGSVAGVAGMRAYVLNIKNQYPSTAPVATWLSGTGGVDVSWDATDWEQIASLAVNYATVGTVWTEFKIEDISLNGSGAGPIALAFVADSALLANPASWHLAAVQANRGSRALPFILTPFALESARCDRYFESTFDHEAGIYPADSLGANHALICRTGGTAATAMVSMGFRVPKFKDPTIKTYNPRTAGAGFDDLSASAVAVSTTYKNRNRVSLLGASASNNTTYHIGVAACAQVWGTD